MFDLVLACLLACNPIVNDVQIVSSNIAIDEDPVTGKPIKKDEDKDKDKGGKGKGK